MNTRSCRRGRVCHRTRRAMAPLEFVLSLPFLLAVMALVFSLGWAALKKSSVAVDARRQAWNARSAPPSSSPLIYYMYPYTLGQVYQECHGRVDLLPSSFGSVTARSGNAVLAGSWDHTEVSGFAGSGPHFGVMRQMGSPFGYYAGPLAAFLSALQNPR